MVGINGELRLLLGLLGSCISQHSGDKQCNDVQEESGAPERSYLRLSASDLLGTVYSQCWMRSITCLIPAKIYSAWKTTSNSSRLAVVKTMS